MKRIFVLALLSLLACWCVRAQRLPETVVPESYDLTFAPDLAKATFTGEAVIHVNVVKSTSTVALNAAELEFQEASITSGGAAQKATVASDASTSLSWVSGRGRPALHSEARSEPYQLSLQPNPSAKLFHVCLLRGEMSCYG